MNFTSEAMLENCDGNIDLDLESFFVGDPYSLDSIIPTLEESKKRERCIRDEHSYTKPEWDYRDLQSQGGYFDDIQGIELDEDIDNSNDSVVVDDKNSITDLNNNDIQENEDAIVEVVL